MGRRVIVFLSVVASLIAVAPAIARAARLKPGDVLITDDKFTGVIDRYRPSNGSFRIFSDNAISMAAGGEGDLSFPIGITFDQRGRVLVADRDSPDGGGVIRIDPNTGAQKVISDNAISTGAGGQAAFDQPSGIVVNNHGTIYVSDFGAVPSVIRVNPKTGAARGVSSDTMLNEPYDLALSGGDAFVTSTHRILRLSLPGGSQHAFVTGHGLAHPAGIVSTPQGNFLVADQKAAKLYAVNRKTGHIRTVSANSRLQHPFGVGIGLNGFDYVADFGALTLFRINPKTGKAKSVVASGQFNNPLGVGIVPR